MSASMEKTLGLTMPSFFAAEQRDSPVWSCFAALFVQAQIAAPSAALSKIHHRNGSPMTTLDISHQRRRTRLPDAAIPQSVKGRFRTLKTRIAMTGAALFFALPWIPMPRGADQPTGAISFDLAAGRFHLFAWEMRTQELYYLTGFLLFAVIALVLANAIAGRVWCGFACPHTVWSDAFLFIERMVEGDRRERLKKREASLNVRRAAEIIIKHAIWIILSLAIGTAAVLYFGDAPAMMREMATGESDVVLYSIIASIAATVYGLGGFFRETMCKAMCPWPRLQGAVWDAKALTVTYRDFRGEPRMSVKKAEELRAAQKPAGDCVDCNLCVAVCPMGIDIRNGPSLACINCGLCVDACDGVMHKIGRPRGLIDFMSWTEVEQAKRGEDSVRPKLWRPKTIALAASLAGFMVLGGIANAMRTDLAVRVDHDRNPIAVKLSDGRVRNGYTLRVTNKANEERRFRVELEGCSSLQLAMPGAASTSEIDLPADTDREIRLTLAGPGGAEGPVTFVVTDLASGQSVHIQDHFIR